MMKKPDNARGIGVTASEIKSATELKTISIKYCRFLLRCALEKLEGMWYAQSVDEARDIFYREEWFDEENAAKPD